MKHARPHGHRRRSVFFAPNATGAVTQQNDIVNITKLRVRAPERDASIKL